jgi:glycerophosphoryl diester phosphodiesterase
VSLPDGLLARPFAHRGLWSPAGPPENSLAAFEAAVGGGYGVELDVRLSAEGEAVVFHDPTLERMTEAQGQVRERTAEELGALTLKGSVERIPTLEQALGLIAGRAPVLVELKTRAGEEGPLERRVADLLETYRGAAAALSFNWRAIGLLADERPRLPRGLNSSDHVDQSADVVPADPGRVLRGIDDARPHFLSLGKELCRGDRLSPLPTVAWTLRSPAGQSAVRHASDTFMFERYRP